MSRIERATREFYRKAYDYEIFDERNLSRTIKKIMEENHLLWIFLNSDASYLMRLDIARKIEEMTILDPSIADKPRERQEKAREKLVAEYWEESKDPKSSLRFLYGLLFG